MQSAPVPEALSSHCEYVAKPHQEPDSVFDVQYVSLGAPFDTAARAASDPTVPTAANIEHTTADMTAIL
jgi:hypothetical protein